MEFLPKDVLNHCVCGHLSLRDIYALARTSRHFLITTDPLLCCVREMYAKWYPKRCFLEAKREKNTKIMQHFQQYEVKYSHRNDAVDAFIKVCEENDITKLHDTFSKLTGPYSDIMVGGVLGAISSLFCGSWACFDELISSCPAIFDRIQEMKFKFSIGHPTLRNKNDLKSFVGECCKRKLYGMTHFFGICGREMSRS